MAQAPPRKFQFKDHPADIQVQVWGRRLPDLFIHAAEAMFTALVGEEQKPGRMSQDVEAQGLDHERLLIAWLRELLYMFDTEGFVATGYAIKNLDQRNLRATVFGYRHDPEVRPEAEIKAVTYHRVNIRTDENGIWTTDLIFDI